MTDALTAGFQSSEPAFPGGIATRIGNEVKGIKRVVSDHTSKPPGTIE